MRPSDHGALPPGSGHRGSQIRWRRRSRLAVPPLQLQMQVVLGPSLMRHVRRTRSCFPPARSPMAVVCLRTRSQTPSHEAMTEIGCCCASLLVARRADTRRWFDRRPRIQRMMRRRSSWLRCGLVGLLRSPTTGGGFETGRSQARR